MSFSLLRRRRTEISLLVVVVIWGFNFPLIKAVLGVMPTHVMNFFRLFSSLLTLGLIWRFSPGSEQRFWAAFRARPLPLLGLGLLGYFIYQVTFIIGLDHTAAGNAAIIMASVPVWSALIGQMLGFERLNRRAWGGLFLSVTGTVLIVLTGHRALSFGGTAMVGNGIVLLAALCWGAYTAFNRPLLRHVSPVSLNLYGLLFSLPFLFLVARPGFAEVDWPRMTPLIWLAIVASGGLSTGVATVLWSAAVRAVGAAQTAAFGNLVPFIALFSSFFFLGEPIRLVQIAGGLLIIAGIFVLQRARRKAALHDE